MIHSPQLFSSKKRGNALHTSNIIECDLKEVKNSISERLMENRLVTVTIDREKNYTQSQFGWLDSEFNTLRQYYQNVFMFCSCQGNPTTVSS